MSRSDIKALARQAMLKSIDVRTKHGLDLLSPVDIYALSKAAGAKVRFVEIASMEGMYGQGDAGTVIWLSSLRPLPRRNFSCGHELGHHVFGHGSTVDELLIEASGAAPRATVQCASSLYSDRHARQDLHRHHPVPAPDHRYHHPPRGEHGVAMPTAGAARVSCLGGRGVRRVGNTSLGVVTARSADR